MANGILLLGLLTALPLSAVLPSEWGWENGVLENLQVIILLAGCATAFWSALNARDRAGRAALMSAAIIWLALAGRELAWGAAFLPPMGFDDHGPIISSRVLWYRPLVPWVCAALLLMCVVGMSRAGSWRNVVARLWHDQAWPWFRLGLVVAGLILSAVSEGHGKLQFSFFDTSTLIVAEETFEVWAYLALWLAQWQIIRRMASWANRLY